MSTAQLVAATMLFVGSDVSPQAATASTGIKRTHLQRNDLGMAGYEAVHVRDDFDPGVTSGKHAHPGEGIICVLEGSLEYQIEGRPPVTLKAGDVVFVPAGAIHTARNAGRSKAAELATYVVEKGKPLLTLAK